MRDSQLRIVRAAPGLVWRALAGDGRANGDGDGDGDEVAGAISATLLPNDRWFVSFAPSQARARRVLLDAVAENTGSDLYITADDTDHEWLRDLAGLGFAELRRESNIVIPTDPAVTGLELTAEPAGTVVISAADAFEDDLRLLDDALRRDVPGAEGWHWDPADFHDETFGRQFDPKTYLVAVDERSGRYVGLARVWITSGPPRLGLIAVLPPYRRRRLASVLLARVFGELHKRGATEVTAEVDDANVASRTLLFGAGARRTSGTVELVLRR